jgi:hypothetical protein
VGIVKGWGLLNCQPFIFLELSGIRGGEVIRGRQYLIA